MTQAHRASTTASSIRPALSALRARGGIAVRFARRAGATRAVEIRESDGYKFRLPRTLEDRPEAAVINTGGGIAGGDAVAISVEMLNETSACVTTPAAERIYRSLDRAPADLCVSLRLGTGASLEWLPQETILFDGARMARRIDVEMADDARLVMAETLVFGRAAMGERLSTGAIGDRWTIRRAGRLVFAEAIRLDGAIGNALSETASAGTSKVVTTILAAAPDAADRLGPVRKALSEFDGIAAASTWNGLLVVRSVSPGHPTTRAILSRALPLLTGRPLPRVWSN